MFNEMMKAKNMKKNVQMEDLVPIFKEQLAIGKMVQFTPSGRSMKPMLDDRTDVVYLKAAGRENIKKWDVVLFKSITGTYIMHRIVKLEGDGFITRGDNCYFNDKKQSYDELIGKVIQFRHKGKKYSVNNILYNVYIISWIMSYIPRKIMWKTYRKIKEKCGK